LEDRKWETQLKTGASFFDVQLRIQFKAGLAAVFAGAIGAKAMAEIGLGVAVHIFIDPLPVSAFVFNVFAG
jgi:hypothetical protein